MLAPPNHGSLLAVTLGDNKVYQVVTGQTGQQLGRDWQRVEGKLATPACEFGILAGGRGDNHGYNLLLPGDNDGIISVETTRLAGAADFRRPARPALPSSCSTPRSRSTRCGSCRKAIFVSEKARTQGMSDVRPAGSAAWITGPCGSAWPSPIPERQHRQSAGELHPPHRGPGRPALCRSWRPDEAIALWVVGLPVHLDGRESEKSREARRFGQWLGEVTGVPRRVLRRTLHQQRGRAAPAWTPD